MSDGKSNKIVVTLLIVLIVIVLGAAVFFGYYIVTKNKNIAEVSSKTTVVKAEAEKTLEFEDFIVNLADTNAKVYLKTKIYVAFPEKNKDIEKEINTKMPEIRDIINTTLRKKTSQEFNGDGLEKVRKELIQKINAVLTSGQITNIYFHEIITQ